ncbi:chemotaxis protein CheW [Clostridium ganghwense]|uniref:Chemotaxis protein CheW n=1 Tax=Clostridium ganghwense TaxID=312089 RepID=A0ABT4CLJ1_9CLOT|nr:chemotaxis protein CheW [Clostridium ganghwense]MCY6369919.1 chemotaxis protein CheW [Clostridium ganghwense]
MKKVLTFYLGQTLFGIELDLVKEITRNIEYTSVFGAKNYIKGLMNLRGNIITIFDLSAIVGEECNKENIRTKCVVLKSNFEDSDNIGFLVDKTGEVIDVKEEDFCELPQNTGESKGKYISSVINLEKEFLRMLNLRRIYNIETLEGMNK